MPIRISCSVNGFRRAGVAHPDKPTVYADDFFTAAQLEALRAEPRLAVEILPADPQTPAIDSASPTGAVDTEADAEPVDADNTAATDDEPHASTLAGVVGADGHQTDLDQLTVAKLKEIAKGLGVENYNALRKADLIAAIQTEQVNA